MNSMCGMVLDVKGNPLPRSVVLTNGSEYRVAFTYFQYDKLKAEGFKEQVSDTGLRPKGVHGL